MHLLQWLSLFSYIANALWFSIKPNEEHCIYELPSGYKKNHDGSWSAGSAPVHFKLSTVMVTGKKELQRHVNDLSEYTWSVDEPMTTEQTLSLGFMYELCWINNGQKGIVDINYEPTKVLSKMVDNQADEGEQSAMALAQEIARKVANIKMTVESEENSHRNRTLHSEETLSSYFNTNVAVFICIVIMAIAQGRAMRKLFDEKILI